MQIKKTQYRNAQAFTLIEMIGVLAVIAILAALVLPKVFESINSARINNTAVSYNTVKLAVVDHYAKFGSLLSSNGVLFTTAASVATNYDGMLLTEGFLDKRFQVKIGDTNSRVQVVTAGLVSVTATAINASHNLDGTGAVNDAVGGVVVQAVIPGVEEADAKDLNDRLDGAALGTDIGTSDLVGRVKYATGTPTTVYIYVTHR